LVLTVKDDGRGFQLAHPPVFTNGHFGIAVMQERARKLGGLFRVQSSPGAGTEILVDIPTEVVKA
jgi:signal transduction histidine kinase